MIHIYPGYNKNNEQENYECLTLLKGSVYSIVGPTGSGKSQFFEDIELLSDSQGVTRRVIKSDASIPVVAHLSQKMNFMVEMSVEEFVTIHASCLGVGDTKKHCDSVVQLANSITGEEIFCHDLLTKLSGGQARSLMIADIAMNPNSDIVLLDEIENAGIDRLKVLKMLSDANKMVLIVTHDPLLALLADFRFVFKDGGITHFLKQTLEEKRLSKHLLQIDRKQSDIRQRLRKGMEIREDYFNEKKITME
ncbi:MAG: ABC transporter ATP-binding protein [Alkaliphilus sp.]|nr:ATP-binding cassette domain-containing protein [bacterium AH-315-G05]PHS28555.1 MAG: ABC transporter ATP-binding protein [Alkaliphilus sp.]